MYVPIDATTNQKLFSVPTDAHHAAPLGTACTVASHFIIVTSAITDSATTRPRVSKHLTRPPANVSGSHTHTAQKANNTRAPAASTSIVCRRRCAGSGHAPRPSATPGNGSDRPLEAEYGASAEGPLVDRLQDLVTA